MEEFLTTIGLEIHVQLKTETKLFCRCRRDPKAPPNVNICPICVGYPGALPVLNKQAVKLALRASLILNMHINKKSIFERKNYFYPDLPKNYQISQYRIPLAENGYLKINGKKVRIQRLHIEEDAAKMIHSEGVSFVDFSRSGSPLIEIVTMPDISDPQEAQLFLETLHRLLVWFDITEGSMEEGNLRCDANISVRPKGQEKLGTKVEVKNINSFRFLKEALEYEANRQINILKNNGSITQETRGYDPVAKKTFTMRTKEFAHDYRYFPEPDLLPLMIDDNLIEEVRNSLGESPDSMKQKFISSYGLSDYAADVLVSDKKAALFFDDLSRNFEDKKLLANFVLEEVLRAVNEGIVHFDKDYDRLKTYTLEVIRAQIQGIISRNSAKEAFREALTQHVDISSAIEKRKITKDIAIEDVIRQVIDANQREYERYKKGEEKLFSFFMGEALKKLKGKADPKTIMEILKKFLSS